MKMIWKHRLEEEIFGRPYTISVPSDATFLSLARQYDYPTIWFTTGDKRVLMQKVRVMLVTTGNEYDDTGMTFMGTFLNEANDFVAHLFVETSFVKKNVLDTKGLGDLFANLADVSVVDTKPVEPISITDTDLPDNGMAFMYRKKDGSERLVVATRLEHKPPKNGRQVINVYDLTVKDFRTLYLDQILYFCPVV